MDALLSLKNTIEDFSVEYDIISQADLSTELNERQIRILMGISSVDEQMRLINWELMRLMNKLIN
ncbi:MAG TPA: hypothetical protein DCR69_08815 [Clostridium sp.]|nr:hypothetical protein [Clostridium sp.]